MCFNGPRLDHLCLSHNDFSQLSPQLFVEVCKLDISHNEASAWRTCSRCGPAAAPTSTSASSRPITLSAPSPPTLTEGEKLQPIFNLGSSPDQVADQLQNSAFPALPTL